jgi:serine/alanine adding enzyme
MQQLQVVELADQEHEDAWQTYVRNSPAASMYHLIEWRDILLRTFGHRSRYLMVQDEHATRGVLPLVEMQSPLFGHFFASLPFLNYGGILADTPAHEAALAAAATRLAQNSGARHIELRQSYPVGSSETGSLENSGWKLRQHKAALVVTLNPDSETHWSGLSSRVRGKVRKAQKSGAAFSVGGAELLDDFYRVFSLNMRDLGTPVYSVAFFRNILRFSTDVKVLLVHRDARPVAGAIALRSKDRVELPWICSDYSQSSSYVNEYLYWNAIQWACNSAARVLDLGRSSIDAGTYRFKLQWNPTVEPLFWYYWLAPGVVLPELNPHNPKYAFAIRCWKKLPVALANRVGPTIVRHIP